jgi:hypothetical protein
MGPLVPSDTFRRYHREAGRRAAIAATVHGAWSGPTTTRFERISPLSTPEALKAALQGRDRLLIDATERAYHRSQNDAQQREHYSGKKQHTLKNTVMSLPDKFIVFLGRTLSGHNHDYTLLKREFPPEVDWFADLNVRVDLGYLGIKADYSGDQIDIPTKKPRKRTL